MTNLLPTKSDRAINELSFDEIQVIKKEIGFAIDEIRSLAFSQSKQKLIDLRFGGVRNSLLHLAVKFNDLLAVKDIIEMSANDLRIINSQNYNQYTPLHFAAIYGNLEIAKFLIKFGADVNSQASQDKRRWAPIHCAAKNNNLKILELLLDNNVDLESKTSFGLTPLIIATEFGHDEIIDFLLKRGADKNAKTNEENDAMNALHYASVDGHFKLVDYLLKAGIERDCKTLSGLSALDFAAKIDNVEIAHLLLAWGVGDLKNALLITKESDSKNVRILIEKYLLMKARIFNRGWLSALEFDLTARLKKFNKTNLVEEKFLINEGVLFNAYGVLSLNERLGFLNKKLMSLRDFCLENRKFGMVNELTKVLNLALENKGNIPLPESLR